MFRNVRLVIKCKGKFLNIILNEKNHGNSYSFQFCYWIILPKWRHDQNNIYNYKNDLPNTKYYVGGSLLYKLFKLNY